MSSDCRKVGWLHIKPEYSIPSIRSDLLVDMFYRRTRSQKTKTIPMRRDMRAKSAREVKMQTASDPTSESPQSSVPALHRILSVHLVASRLSCYLW